MTKDKYINVAEEQLASGLIDQETFWAMIDNANDFCEDEEE